MIGYFLDSSAIVKRYLAKEKGSAWVSALAAPQPQTAIAIAYITLAEAVSAFQRRSREGLLSARSAHAARVFLDRHAEREYVVIRLSAAVMQAAQDLLERHALRAYDAVQLASALMAKHGTRTLTLTEFTFVSADTRLLAAARAEGLTTDNPDAYP